MKKPVEQLKKSDYYSMIPPDVKPEDLIKEMRESDLGSVFAVMDLAVEVIIRFKGKDKALLITLDDGKCIALDKSVNNKDLITDSYDLVRKVANNIEYQYILNMNYSRISIEYFLSEHVVKRSGPRKERVFFIVKLASDDLIEKRG